jgi:hypothetical protein
MVLALVIDSFELAIVRSHTRCEFEATGVRHEEPEIVLGILCFEISVAKFLDDLDDTRIGVFVVLSVQIELGNTVHGGLTGDEIEEVIALCLRPRFDGIGEIELDYDTRKELIVTGCWFRSSQSLDTGCNCGCAESGVHAQGILGSAETLLQTIDAGVRDIFEVAGAKFAHVIYLL